jgi:hypothetical protein
MSNSQWSNEQPPAWQGPNPPAPNSQPPAPAAGWKQERLSVLLGLTWGLFSKNAKPFLIGNLVVVGIGAVVTLAFLRVYPIELSTISQSLLNGDPKPLDDAIALAESIEEQSQITLDAILPILKLLALTFPFIAITSLVASVLATKVGLDNSDENSNVEINWLKVTTATLATFGYLLVGLVPVVVIAVFVPAFTLIATILLIPYLVWVGLGLAMIYPISMAENIGGTQAVKRSLVLSRNNRRRIFAVVIIVGILASLPGAALNQFLLLVPSSILNYVEATTMSNFAGMLISVPISTCGIVILYRYFHAKFHS